MEKNVIIGILYEYYGELLTEKQSESIELYYLEDLSLTEIADVMKISKQSVSENIKRSEKTLLNFEDKLGIYAKSKEINNLINRLELDLMEDLDDEKFSEYIGLIFEIKSKLL